MSDTVLEPPLHTIPVAFTRAMLDWLPWLEPLAVEALTERHMAGLVDAARAKSPYFRLLARDPDALQALLDAGWSTTDIVTLSQIAAFLSFQIRVIAGLRVQAAAI